MLPRSLHVWNDLSGLPRRNLTSPLSPTAAVPTRLPLFARTSSRAGVIALGVKRSPPPATMAIHRSPSDRSDRHRGPRARPRMAASATLRRDARNRPIPSTAVAADELADSVLRGAFCLSKPQILRALSRAPLSARSAFRTNARTPASAGDAPPATQRLRDAGRAKGGAAGPALSPSCERADRNGRQREPSIRLCFCPDHGCAAACAIARDRGHDGPHLEMLASGATRQREPGESRRCARSTTAQRRATLPRRYGTFRRGPRSEHAW